MWIPIRALSLLRREEGKKIEGFGIRPVPFDWYGRAQRSWTLPVTLASPRVVMPNVGCQSIHLRHSDVLVIDHPWCLTEDRVYVQNDTVKARRCSAIRSLQTSSPGSCTFHAIRKPKHVRHRRRDDGWLTNNIGIDCLSWLGSVHQSDHVKLSSLDKRRRTELLILSYLIPQRT